MTCARSRCVSRARAHALFRRASLYCKAKSSCCCYRGGLRTANSRRCAVEGAQRCCFLLARAKSPSARQKAPDKLYRASDSVCFRPLEPPLTSVSAATVVLLVALSLMLSSSTAHAGQMGRYFHLVLKVKVFLSKPSSKRFFDREYRDNERS